MFCVILRKTWIDLIAKVNFPNDYCRQRLLGVAAKLLIWQFREISLIRHTKKKINFGKIYVFSLVGLFSSGWRKAWGKKNDNIILIIIAMENVVSHIQSVAVLLRKFILASLPENFRVWGKMKTEKSLSLSIKIHSLIKQLTNFFHSCGWEEKITCFPIFPDARNQHQQKNTWPICTSGKVGKYRINVFDWSEISANKTQRHFHFMMKFSSHWTKRRT